MLVPYLRCMHKHIRHINITNSGGQIPNSSPHCYNDEMYFRQIVGHQNSAEDKQFSLILIHMSQH